MKSPSAAKNRTHLQPENEEALQFQWCLTPRETELETLDNRNITVLSTGTWNREAGPDFLDASLLLDGREIRGDIEIHLRQSDWRAHGHDTDPRYEDVVLHVVAVPGAGGPDIPTVLIGPEPGNSASGRKVPNGKCVRIFSSYSDEELKKLLIRAGTDRFLSKADAFRSEILSRGPRATFERALFDAMGYKKNREAFAELYSLFSRYSDTGKAMPEGLLFGISGLLPDPSVLSTREPMRGHLRKLWSEWWPSRTESMSPDKWNRGAVRPLNSPERRIAAVAVLLQRLGNNPLRGFAEYAVKLPPGQFRKKVEEEIVVYHDVWKDFSSFSKPLPRPAAALGRSRATDIAVNIILPQIYASGQIDGNGRLCDGALKIYTSYPRGQANRTLKNASDRWFFPPERRKSILTCSAAAQGALHLYKKFCLKNSSDCARCFLG